MITRSENPPSLAMKILGIALLAGFGAVVGGSVTHIMFDRDMPWADGLAVLMGAALLAMAVASAVVMVTRPASVPKGCGLLQVAVFALAGLMFLAPVYATRWAGPDVVFAGIIVLLIVQSVGNVMLWNKADEMYRRTLLETGAMAFIASEFALFVYAAAERLGLVAPVTSWGLIGIVMAIYIVASCVAAARRGIT